MLVTENNKKIYFNISGYEFPKERPSNEEYNFDANWLNCEIKYFEGDFNQVCIDPCLLTYELEDLIFALSKILDGTESEYNSMFMEPYLKISIAKVEDKIRIVFKFMHDTLSSPWGIWEVDSLLEKKYATEILNELKELQKNYPQR